MIGTTSGGDGSIWVFGYGSLMWRPDFAYVEAAPALLHGYHRAFCIYSVHYRGTRARPGLILGLDRGGSCRGRAFRVAAPDAAGVIDYLDSRELVTNVYIRRNLPIMVGGARIRALAYVADPTHAQYAGTLPPRTGGQVDPRRAAASRETTQITCATSSRTSTTSASPTARHIGC